MKNSTLAYYGLTTLGKFLTHIGSMFCFLPPENVRKPEVFKSFQGLENETLAQYELRQIYLYKYCLSH